MLAYLRKVMRRAEDRGSSAVEYGLMVAAIAAVIVGAVFALGQGVSASFENSKNSLCGQPGIDCASATPDAP